MLFGSFLLKGMLGNSKNPADVNSVMIFPGYTTGFGLLTNSTLDQRVDTRGREDDLRPVISLHPELLGIGIDQSATIQKQFKTINKELILKKGL